MFRFINFTSVTKHEKKTKYIISEFTKHETKTKNGISEFTKYEKESKYGISEFTKHETETNNGISEFTKYEKESKYGISEFGIEYIKHILYPLLITLYSCYYFIEKEQVVCGMALYV